MFGAEVVELSSGWFLENAWLTGLIPVLGFAVILWVAWRRRDLLGGYVYPRVLLYIGLAAWLLTLFLGYKSLSGLALLWA